MKLAVVLFSAFALAPSTAQDLPDGPGKAAVEKLCSDCHGLATIIGLRRTKTAWEATVDEMAARGAKGTDEEFDQVVNYLSRYLGKVNVNRADAKEIEATGDFTASEAEAIVRFRGENGDFKSLDDVEKVPGLDKKRVMERRDRIVFN